MDIWRTVKSWRRSLAGKILTSMLAIHLVLFSILFYSVLNIVKNNHTEQFIDYVRTDNQRVSELIMYKLQNGDIDKLTAFIEDLLLGGQPVALTITDSSGHFIYPPGKSLEKEDITKEDFFFGENNDELYYIKSAITANDGSRVAHMQLTYDEGPILDELSELYRNAGIIGLIYLFIVFVSTGVIEFYIIRPLSNLTKGANRIASGKYDEHFHSDTHIEEVEQLTHSLETMRNELVMRGKKLSDSEQRLMTLVDNIADAVIVCDLQGNILSSNRALLQIVDNTSDDLIDSNINKLISFNAVLKSMKKPASERLYETTILRKDNTKISIEVNVSELQQDKRHLLLVLLRDISERKRGEFERQQYYSEMAHAGRLSIMGEMAVGLAHELNQPLAAISLYLQGCLRLQVPENAQFKNMKHAVKEAEEQATRAAGIIRRIRSFVRKESVNEDFQVVDINKLIQRSAEFAMLDKKYAAFYPDLEFAQWSLLAKVDGLQIELVLVNLIRNALDAMSHLPADKIELKISSIINADGLIQVTVVDSGEGVLEKNVKKIFDTYFTTKNEGLGMGLAISRSIIEEHDGRLWCRSRAGNGSEFCFTLPVHDA
ncbi:hypothetical protein MNBD_GAMMA06-949 [hydrothermal vent metagenome]|uniref:histidine kinase n=1 Tax=hydrothermal vent metagenome TaxID=652676 RepID=A0A3B0X3W5_9ZZZZ